ncbi:hypothetical protein [Streptomyces aureocirculatus]|uniref:hypothetical protein n=1 Tax=Streptomyces aureocirculatus TaxID=67275 RepID=UPI0018FE67BC|nr:hypothetical protein [Streptomyces aureocirculatus]
MAAVMARSPLTSAGCCLPGESTGAAATNCSYTLRISACPVAMLPGGNASTASGSYDATIARRQLDGSWLWAADQPALAP